MVLDNILDLVNWMDGQLVTTCMDLVAKWSWTLFLDLVNWMDGQLVTTWTWLQHGLGHYFGFGELDGQLVTTWIWWQHGFGLGHYFGFGDLDEKEIKRNFKVLNWWNNWQTTRKENGHGSRKNLMEDWKIDFVYFLNLIYFEM